MLKNIKIFVCLTKYRLGGGVTPFIIYKSVRIVLPDGTCLPGDEGALLFQPCIVQLEVAHRAMYGWETSGLRNENGRLVDWQ